MSAEKTINNYLDDKSNNLTLESLQTYVQEGIDFKPLHGLISFLNNVSSIAAIQNLFSSNKKLVHMALNKAMKAADDDLFGEDEEVDEQSHKENNPTNQPAPTDEKEAESYLKRLYLYFKDYIKGLNFSDIKTIFKTAVAIMTKMLIAVGIVATIMVTWYVIPIAIIVVVICMLNAVDQTKDIGDETQRIDIKSAFKNVMEGFKRMVTSLKIEKGQAKFGILSTLIAGTLLWIKSNMSNIASFINKYITKSSNMASKAPDKIRLFIDVLSGVHWDKAKDLRTVLHNALNTVTGLNQDKKDILAGLYAAVYEDAIANGKSPKQAKVLAAKKVTERYAKLTNTSNVADKTTKVLVIAVSIVGIATIIYLFSEMVDNFNLKKIKEREDEREEFERSSR